MQLNYRCSPVLVSLARYQLSLQVCWKMLSDKDPLEAEENHPWVNSSCRECRKVKWVTAVMHNGVQYRSKQMFVTSYHSHGV